MNIQIGTDIVLIARIQKAMNSSAFQKKVFTSGEITYAGTNIERLAGFFAAKEAVVKAFQTGFFPILPRDIEIIHLGNIPKVLLHHKAKEFAEKKQIQKIHISISHEKDYALGFSIIEYSN